MSILEIDNKADNKKATVLFVDDELDHIEQLFRSLSKRGAEFGKLKAFTEHQAISLQADHHPEVAVVDLSLDPLIGPESGFSLISKLLSQDPTMRILVLTGHGSREYGIKALQHGAASFIEKPADANHLLTLITDAINYCHLKRDFNYLCKQNAQANNFIGIYSLSDSMKEVIKTAQFAATHSQPLLILGETGTGKGIIANAIHRAAKNRKGKFIRFQPSFGSQDLVSSELFGHQKGAFTGATELRSGLLEESDKGTLFIDEVGDLPHQTQIMLLDVLQEKRFRRLGSNKELKADFRLISATNKSIEECLKKSLLREDFYHRISHLRIIIPPLRERVEDIPLLAQQFIERITNTENLPVQGISNEALGKLTRYSWPGNVRELQSTIEGGVYRAAYEGRRFLEATDIHLNTTKPNAPNLSPAISFREKVFAFEEHLVKEALTKTKGNQTLAANLLKLDRTSLRRILNRKTQ